MVNLSIYDDNFGDVVGAGAGASAVLGGGRYLDIVGTMDKGAYGGGLVSLASWASAIKANFNNAGWSVSSVDLTWDGQRYRFRISAWVRNEHSDAEVRDGARRVLLNVKQGALGFQAFSNVYVSLEQANSQVGANTGGTVGAGGNTGSGSAGGGPLDSWVPSSLQGSLSPLAVGLGVTTGTVLVGGILIAIIILKKT